MKYYDKKCEKCNEKYTGTASSKYCLECKDEIARERNKENSKKQRNKKII